MAALFKGKFGKGKKSGHSQQPSKSSGGQPSSSASSEAGDDVSGIPDRIVEPVPSTTVTREPQVTREEDQGGGASDHEREADSGFGLGPTVQINSIFSGLQLSNKVAKEEASDSPYIFSQVDEEASSSFSFLQASEDSIPTQDENLDPTSTEDQAEVGGFSFLQDTPTLEQSKSKISESVVDIEDAEAPPPVDTSLTKSQDISTHFQDLLLPQQLHGSSSPTSVATFLNQNQAQPITTNDDLLGKDHHQSEVDGGDGQAKDRYGRHSPVVVGRKQQPVKGNKKIKRKAVRPGQIKETVESEGDAKEELVEGGSHHSSHTSIDTTEHSHEEQLDNFLPVGGDCYHEDEELQQSGSKDELVVVAKDISDVVARETGEVETREGDKIAGRKAEISGVDIDNSKNGDEPDMPLSGHTSFTHLPQTTAPPSSSPSTPTPDDTPTTRSSSHQFTVETQPNTEGHTGGGEEVSAQHELTGVLDSYSKTMCEMRSQLLAATEKHRTMVLGKSHRLQQQAKMWEETESLREREARALSEEDYELVEELRKKLEETEMRTERQLASSGVAEIQFWLAEVEDRCKGQVNFQDGMSGQLKLVKEGHHDTLEKLRSSQASELAKVKLQLHSLTNEVERKAGHIALDRSHWEKRRQLIEEEANKRAATSIAKKNLLSSQLSQVEEEIRELEEKLASLRSERTSILAAISKEEEQIETVNAEFSEEKEQLHQEDQVLQEKEQLLEQQQCSVQDHQTQLEAIQGGHYSERDEIESQMKQAVVVLNEIQASISAQPMMETHLQELKAMADRGRELFITSQELTSCVEQEQQKKEEVKTQTQMVLEGQSSLGASRKRLRDLQEKLLELQDSKKAAVTGRQFKEASRFAGLVKTATVEVSEEEKKLCGAEATMKSANERLAVLGRELTACQDKVAQLERSEDEACISSVLGDVRILQEKGAHSKLLQDKFPTQENLPEAMDAWRKVYLSLSECLCARHGLNFSNMYSDDHSEPTSAEEEHVSPNCVDTANTPEPLVPDSTPNSATETIDSAKVSTIEIKCQELEKAIEKACEEEDYDKAAALEEELVGLRQQLET